MNAIPDTYQFDPNSGALIARNSNPSLVRHLKSQILELQSEILLLKKRMSDLEDKFNEKN
jgi:hypothetical protein